MGILDELSSATGDKNANKELVKRCLDTPPLLHSIAEGLRTGSPKAKPDCAQILIDVGMRNPDLLAHFVSDFLDASRLESARIAKLGFKGLALTVSANPNEIYAERAYLLEATNSESSLAMSAAAVLAELCGNNPNYRGKLVAPLVRRLNKVAGKDLLKWVKTIGPAIAGSPDAYRRLENALSDRLPALPEAEQKKMVKLLVKLEKTTVKRR